MPTNAGSVVTPISGVRQTTSKGKDRVAPRLRHMGNTSNNVKMEEAKFCAPMDFGDWHITVDGEETLCGKYSVESHHISGSVGNDYDNTRDCPKCRQIYERKS